MQNIVFTDLDDTLFQSLKKCPVTEGLEPGASLVDGELFSFSTPKQRQLLQMWVDGGAWIIPVTARTLAAYKRVHISFNSTAIIQHGGLIIDKNNAIDPEWYEIMRTVLEPYRSKLGEARIQITELAEKWDIPANVRITSEEGLDFYLLLKHRDKSTTDLGAFGEELEKVAANWPGYWQHRNGNNWALLPEVLSKEIALKFLLERYKSMGIETFTIGCGDSRSDFPFLHLCDYALFPQRSQLSEVLHANHKI